MYGIEREDLTHEILRDKALLVEPLLNSFTVYTSTMFPKEGIFHTVPVNSNYTVKNY